MKYFHLFFVEKGRFDWDCKNENVSLDDLIGIVRTKMYLCHITLLMLKDTKSLGNNNASAWESRGVVIKKEGMHFDTPSLLV